MNNMSHDSTIRSFAGIVSIILKNYIHNLWTK
jgi:hypothetical protein